MRKKYASNYERELQKKLWENGFICIRVAGSGSSSYPAPDLIVIKNGKVSVIEVKSTRGSAIYLDYSQMDQLKKLEREVNGVFIAVKFIEKGWYFIELNRLNGTNKIEYTHVSKIGYTFESFIEKLNDIHN